MAGKQPIVTTKCGQLRGTWEDGLYVFRGVPYAAPPVGALRWRAPQPAKPWSGIRPAEKFGPIAPQDPVPMAIPGRKPSEEPQSEDCLFLNIWTPGIDEQRRAVMVWVHGGAFTRGSGSAPTNPGSNLAKRGGVVVVTINYRLGPLGFLPLKDLTGGKIPATGSEALLDQVEALKWVRDNIAAFGGDPQNVTVFGESAGAMSIGALLAMKEAHGLFQKAVLQSGASTFRPLDQSVKVAELYLGVLGVKPTDIDGLMALTPEQLIMGQRALASTPAPAGVRGANLEPVLDGEFLREAPLDVIQRGSARDVTVMAGSNLEEGKLFAMMGRVPQDMDEASLVKRLGRMVPEQYVSGLIDKYRKALSDRGVPATPYEVYVYIQGDQQFRMPNVRLCEFQEKLGRPSYGYVFTWKSAAPGFGACHALDVGFVFGSLQEEFHGCGPGAERLAGEMQDAWTAFARTGDPSTAALNWPVYGTKRTMMVFGEHSHVEDAPYEAQRVAWEGIANKLLG